MGDIGFNDKEIARKAGQSSSRSKELIGKQSRRDLARLTEHGLKKAKTWLDQVAVDNPGRAFSLWVQLLEYTHPKLSRREAITIGAHIELTVEEREQYIKQIVEDHVNRPTDTASPETVIHK